MAKSIQARGGRYINAHSDTYESTRKASVYITTLLVTLVLALHLSPLSSKDNWLAYSTSLGSLLFEKPIKIELPDGLPHIKDMRDFVGNITQRVDYQQPLESRDGPVVSRSEAASLAFELARKRNLPPVVLCDKYYLLFASDKYLTRGGVEELIEDARFFDEIEQPDANLAAHLQAENNYGALRRLVTLHTVLIEEGIGVVSSIDVKVQKNILQCMKYYKERHERALDGLSGYLWKKRDEIPQYKGDLDKLMIQFNYYMEIIKRIEGEIDTKLTGEEEDEKARVRLKNELLNRMAKMHKILELASPIIPDSVLEFIADERRANHFKGVTEIMSGFEHLKRRVLELENEQSRLSDYREALLALYQFAEPHKEWLQEEYSFITEPRRDSLILGHIFKLEHENIEMPIPRQLINPNVEAVVKSRMMQQARKRKEEAAVAASETVNDLSRLPNLDRGNSDESASRILLHGMHTQEAMARPSDGWAEKPFRLQRDSTYTEKKVIPEYDISFYVEPGFENEYKGEQLLNTLSDAISEVIADLQAKCKMDPSITSDPCNRVQQILKKIDMIS